MSLFAMALNFTCQWGGSEDLFHAEGGRFPCLIDDPEIDGRFELLEARLVFFGEFAVTLPTFHELPTFFFEFGGR